MTLSHRLINGKSRGKIRISLAITSIAIMATSGCSPNDSDGGYQPSRYVEDMTFRWSAEPGISLTEGPAVAVRAYIESYDRALFAQDEQAAYHGFDRVVAANEGDIRSPTGLRRPYTRFLAMEAPRTVGPEHLHIQRITRSGDRTEAIVCNDVRRLSQIFDNDWRGATYRSISTDGLLELYGSIGTGFPLRMSVSVMRIVMTGTSQPNSIAQHGDNDFPQGDVFGDWSIDEFSWYSGDHFVQVGNASVTPPLPWSPADADLKPCQQFAQPPIADPHTDGKNPLFPHEPSVPGWPR